MPMKKVNAKLLWMQFEDVLAPRLGLTVRERAVYCYLLRHSLVVGESRLRFAIAAISRSLRMSGGSARLAVRRLTELGAVRVIGRNTVGHFVEVRLPEKIRAVRTEKNAVLLSVPLVKRRSRGTRPEAVIETTDFVKERELRRAIHARECGACFYCLRRTTAKTQVLDHVVAQVQFGRNSYRNLVSCCANCNAHKSDREAKEFLRELYRKGRLTGKELDTRLKALKDLAAGKLRPMLLSNRNHRAS